METKDEIEYGISFITVSDRAYNKQYEDLSGKTMKEYFEQESIQQSIKTKLINQIIVPDEIDMIANALKQEAENESVNLILTSGGTGLCPRDVTPEATKSVIEKDCSSIMIYVTTESCKITPFACFSRSVCGILNNTLIINLPGKPKAVNENLDILMTKNLLKHALKSVNGECLH